MRLAATLGIVLSVSCSPAAAASPLNPSAYKAKLNTICRSYTPLLDKARTLQEADKKANNHPAVLRDFGIYLGLALRQDKKLYAVPLPAAERQQMTPIFAIDRHGDTLIEQIARASLQNDTKQFQSRLNAMTKFVAANGARINVLYDHAGLQDCGSGQI